MQEKEQSRSSRLAIRRHSFFLLFLGCAAFCLLLHLWLKGKACHGRTDKRAGRKGSQ